MKIRCPECDTTLRVPGNVTSFLCPRCSTELDVRRGREKSGSYVWVVFLVLGLAIPLMLGAVGFCMMGPTAAPRPTNARCGHCGQEFNIPVHHGVGQWERDYACPNCGIRTPAVFLYRQRAGE